MSGFGGHPFCEREVLLGRVGKAWIFLWVSTVSGVGMGRDKKE